MKTTLIVTAVVAVVAMVIGFNVLLGSGCELDSGAITWHGKVCIWAK